MNAELKNKIENFLENNKWCGYSSHPLSDGAEIVSNAWGMPLIEYGTVKGYDDSSHTITYYKKGKSWHERSFCYGPYGHSEHDRTLTKAKNAKEIETLNDFAEATGLTCFSEEWNNE